MYYLRNPDAGLGQWEFAVPIAGSLVSGITGLFMGEKKKKEAEKQRDLAMKIAREQALAQNRQEASAQALAVQQAQIESVASRNRTISVGLIVFGTFALGLGSIFLLKALSDRKKER